MNDNPATATIGAEEVDDGYISPDFGLPSEDEDPKDVPASKRRKQDRTKTQEVEVATLESDEALALRLLRGGT